MRYIPPFSTLCETAGFTPGRRNQSVKLSYERMIEILRRIATAIEIDEGWYLARYPDVAQAIEAGTVASALAWLDGTRYLDHHDARLKVGKVGLWTKADSITAFDDLVIRGVAGSGSSATSGE